MSVRAGLPFLLGLLALALAMYTPWVSVPFPVLDYSEFLNRLRAGDSFWQSLANVTEFYQAHGRSSYLGYLQLTLNWTLAGEHPVGWDLATFGYMALAVGTSWVLFIKLGNTHVAAAGAAALLIVATPAVHTWLRPTSEPLVLAFLCVALMVAVIYQDTPRWPRDAAIMLLLFLCIGLAKDVLTPLMLVPLAVACCWRDGFNKPAPSARNLALTAGTAGIALMLIMLIAAVVSRAPADAYARAYSPDNVSVAGFLQKFTTNVLPHTRGYDTAPIGAGRLLANALFVGLILAAMGAAARTAQRRALHQLTGGLALAGFGALLYTPLRWYTPFYALPFFLGSALMFACALSVLEHGRPLTRRLARAAALVVILAGAITSFNIARRETAFRRIHGELADAMIANQGFDSVIVTTSATDARRRADEVGFIRHHALLRGHAAPATRATACAAGSDQTRIERGPIRTARVMLVNYPDVCGELPFPATQLAQPYLALTPWPVHRYLRLEFVIFQTDLRLPTTQRKGHS